MKSVTNMLTSMIDIDLTNSIFQSGAAAWGEFELRYFVLGSKLNKPLDNVATR